MSEETSSDVSVNTNLIIQDVGAAEESLSLVQKPASTLPREAPVSPVASASAATYDDVAHAVHQLQQDVADAIYSWEEETMSHLDDLEARIANQERLSSPSTATSTSSGSPTSSLPLPVSDPSARAHAGSGVSTQPSSAWVAAPTAPSSSTVSRLVAMSPSDLPTTPPTSSFDVPGLAARADVPDFATFESVLSGQRGLPLVQALPVAKQEIAAAIRDLAAAQASSEIAAETASILATRLLHCLDWIDDSFVDIAFNCLATADLTSAVRLCSFIETKRPDELRSRRESMRLVRVFSESRADDALLLV